MASAGLLSTAVLTSPAVADQTAKASRLVGTWVLTDNDNVPFNLILRSDGTSLTVIGKRHPDVDGPQRMTRNQLVEQGSWRPWGNGIRSDYGDGWTDTIQVGPAGPVGPVGPGEDLPAAC